MEENEKEKNIKNNDGNKKKRIVYQKEKNKWNKAGHSANTSCGRVGRGGNARFHTFQLENHGSTDQRIDGRTDGRTDGPTDRRTDGPTDKASYRVACPQLKRKRSRAGKSKRCCFSTHHGIQWLCELMNDWINDRTASCLCKFVILDLFNLNGKEN